MTQQSSRFETQNKNIAAPQPAGRFFNNNKKLPKAKLFFAGICLLALIFTSKNLFATSSAKTITGLQPTTSVVLGAQTSQTQSSTLANSTAVAITPTPVPVPTPAPTPIQTSKNVSTPIANSDGKQLKIINTPTGYLNVRNMPSISGSLIGRVNPGETYTYTSSENGWYQIRLKSKQYGWIDGEYISLKNAE